MKKILIKIGGSILDQEKNLLTLGEDIKAMQALGCQIVIVHGGGKAISQALAESHICSEFIEGLRVTCATSMSIIEEVLCEKVNAFIVEKLQASGVQALGLSGAQQQMLLCDYYSEQHGFVGEIKEVKADFAEYLLNLQTSSQSLIPVIAALGVDENGNTLNVNADMAACHIANALKVDQLIYLTDQDGIYDNQGSLLPKLNEEHLQTLINDSTVKGGMLVKVKSILESLKQGLNRILILNGNKQQVLLQALGNNDITGTICKKLS